MEAATARSYPARIEATLFDIVLLREKITTRQEQLADRLSPESSLDRFEDLIG